MWKPGDEAIFDCDPRYLNYTIPTQYASSHLLGKYQNWKQIDKKRVIISQVITANQTFKVYLKDDGPTYTFVIDGLYLKKAPAGQTGAGCSCSTQTLMIRGCVCGSFKKEAVKMSSDITPW